MSVVAVSGSRGLIGRALVPRLRELGAEVHAYDLGDPIPEPQDVDGWVDLAGVSRPGIAAREPRQAWDTNVTRAAHLSATLASLGKWYLYASSREVYGNGTAGVEAPYAPVGPYARTKVAGECATLNNGGSVIRYSNVYGGIGDHADRVIPHFVAAALDRAGTVPIDTHSGSYDFVYIENAVAETLRAVSRLGAGASQFVHHVATGVSTSLLDLVSLVSDVTGHKLSISPFRGLPKTRAHDVALQRTIAHPVRLREGLARYVQLLRDTPPESRFRG